MKLCQNIILKNGLAISTFIGNDKLENLQALSGKIELSFYPFTLQVFSERKRSKALLEKTLVFSLNIKISDDEHKKPIFSGLSPNRSLLLISELIQNLQESCSAFGLHLLLIQALDTMLEIRFSSASMKDVDELVGALLLLKYSLDGQLFVRGLKIDEGYLSCPLDVKHPALGILSEVWEYPS